jgi:hypothetical protein
MDQLSVFSKVEYIADSVEETINQRNESWKNSKAIPSWVNLETVDLDQFYTKSSVAEDLFCELKLFLESDGVRIDDCIFIEPSAGNGAFFNLLPRDKRIGLDIYPACDGINRQDFLFWNLPDKFAGKKIVFIGNPPFGYRAWLALAFMNRASMYADYIGFILPMAFQSEGKGSPKHRVVGMNLKSSKRIDNDSFYLPDKRSCKINALWQIWKKGENKTLQNGDCSDYIELFTVDERKERLCGQEKKNEADYFLQRTYYNMQPTLVKNFSEVKYVCGYGIIIKKEREKVVNALLSVDWDNYSNLATHNCRHISMYHIKTALMDKEVINVG